MAAAVGMVEEKNQEMEQGMAHDYDHGVTALSTLKSYATNLDGKYGKKAFYFSKADMQILKEK